MNRSVVIVCVLLLTTSCNVLKKKPNRKNVTVDSSTAVTVTDTMIPGPIQGNLPSENPIATTHVLSTEKQELIQMLMPMWEKRIDYNTFKGKAKMHYEGSGMKQDFTANFRMAKDSVIWVHISAGMGLVNVARVLITPDSLKLVNYLDKSIMMMSAADAREKLPASIDFDLLQNLVIGEALSSDAQPVDATDFGGTWSLDLAGADGKQQVNYNKADSNMRSLQVLSNLGGGFAGMIQFGNYTNIKQQKFATSRAINVQNRGEQHYLDMNFNNASFNDELSFPFSIPTEYEHK